jgi:hypothetical protein
MKKLVLLLSLACLLLATNLYAQEVVPNSSFESWIDYVTYEDPEFYTTPNYATSLVGKITTTKDTIDPYDGAYSVRMETQNILGTFDSPGLLTLGDFYVDFKTQEVSITSGEPINSRPDFITGFYKYLPVDGDFWSFTAIFTRWNGTSRDTIGGSVFASPDTITEWTQFTIPVIFWDPADPDTFNFIIASSSLIELHVGSVLNIDKLEFLDGVGMDNPELSSSINIFQDQANRQLIVYYDFNEPKNVELRIYNISGQQMKIVPELSVTSYSQTVSVADLPKGIYIVEVNDGREIMTKKIIL